MVKGIQEVSFPTGFGKESKKEKLTLIGIIRHHGEAGGGHYNAYSYHPTKKKWFLYDDSSREAEVTKNEVVEKGSKDGYIFVYKIDKKVFKTDKKKDQ